MDNDYLKHLFKYLEKFEGQNIETNVLSKPSNFEDKPIIKENVITNTIIYKKQKDWATYIKEWISIYNVANNIDKIYLQKLGKGEIEKCGFNNEEICPLTVFDDNIQKTIECSTYKSREQGYLCISKKRIKKWRELPEHGSKDKSILYKLLSIKELKLRGFYANIYYYKYLSSLTQNILITFPTGLATISEFLFENIEIKNFIEDLLDSIIINHTNNQIYIFCGHSMGSILAFYAGYLMKEKNSVFFDKHCIVIGSGHFKWMPETIKSSFSNLQNVKAYVYGEIHEETLFLDKYYDLRFDGKTHYSPSTYLIKKNNIEFIEIDDIKQYNLNYNSEDMLLHDWQYYYNALKYLYVLNNKKGGNKKSKRYRKYKKKCSKTKRINK